LDLSGRNPLVNISVHKMWLLDEDVKKAEKVYKQQQFFLKEYALQTTLLSSHFIKWKHPKKDKFYTSPLFIKPVKVLKNQKIELQFDVEYINDNFTINPIVKNEFNTLFNIDLTTVELNRNKHTDEIINTLIKSLESNGNRMHLTDQFSVLEQWEIIKIDAVGIFNYKKAILAKDYDLISQKPNNSILNLLGENLSHSQQLNQIDVVNVNSNQLKAIEQSSYQNTVIQGPPGTGKSNTIVELIKEFLLKGKSVLFVSEKKSALDVVFQKLCQEDLGLLSAYFDASKQQKKQFYQRLKQTINLLQTNQQIDENKQINQQIAELESFFKAYLQLKSTNTKEQVSIINLLEDINQNQYPLDKIEAKSTITPYKNWMKYAQFLEELEVIAISKFNSKTLSDLSFISLNQAIFTQAKSIDLLSKRLKELKLILQSFSELDAVYNLNWSWSDWSTHSVASSVLQMANRSQIDVLDPNSKKHKSFNTWSKKYDLLKHKLELSQKFVENWRVKPKVNQIEDLIDELKQYKPSLFNRFKKLKAKIVFKNYKQNISVEQQIKVLHQLKDYYQLQHQFNEVKLKLKHNLGILNPDIEINQLMAMRQKLEANSHQQYEFLLEHPHSLQLIEDLHQLQPKIQQANQIKRFLFHQLEDLSIDELYQMIKKIDRDLPLYNYYLPEIKKYLGLPSEVLNFVRHNNYSVKALTGLVTFHTYHSMLRFENHLKNLKGSDLQFNFKKLKNLKALKNKQVVGHIITQKQNQWHQVEQLIQTPSSKLNSEQKLLKKAYKHSKKIIFHESAKQQQHLPIKSLIEQTNNQIFDLLPLWMMNPLTISEGLPCQANLFDVVIFDEASQIPLEDSLPAIYRANQMVIVGDSKQMPPSQFFTHSKETISLLMEAETSLPALMLNTHYRSHQPKLIQFSNQQFYDNELNYFPPSTTEVPLVLNYIKNGVFDKGKNNIEAIAVAEAYKQYLLNGNKSVGIIAFSKEQEQEIVKQIQKLNLSYNEQLLVRNLENTQGIERDYIIISVGYGFNKEGVFRQNFGPINQAFGANRLNVMLTRSQKQITVCCSVKSSDFKWSENRGVQLLKAYLLFVENESTKDLELPENTLQKEVYLWFEKNENVQYNKAINGQMMDCFINTKSNKILLIDPGLNPNESEDIYSQLDILNQRFNAVKVLLSTDYFNNKERFKSEVLSFLK